LEETDFEGKDVTVFFDDKTAGIGRKDARCVRLTSTSIILRNQQGDLEVIPLARVVRIIQRGEC
jgi:hypothetical protein